MERGKTKTTTYTTSTVILNSASHNVHNLHYLFKHFIQTIQRIHIHKQYFRLDLMNTTRVYASVWVRWCYCCFCSRSSSSSSFAAAAVASFSCLIKNSKLCSSIEFLDLIVWLCQAFSSFTDRFDLSFDRVENRVRITYTHTHNLNALNNQTTFKNWPVFIILPLSYSLSLFFSHPFFFF